MGSIAQHFTAPMALVLIGTLLSSAGALWATYQQNRERAGSAVQRAEAEKALREKTEEIARLNREIASSVTGGDAYPAVIAYTGDGAPDQAALMMSNMGDYPLYDLTVRVVDLAEFNRRVADGSLRSKSIAETLGRDVNIGVGNLGPNQGRMVGTVSLPPGEDRKSYNLFFMARNGPSSEELRFRRVQGRWVAALRVSRGTPDGKVPYSVLHVQTDPLFPKAPDGSVDWSD